MRSNPLRTRPISLTERQLSAILERGGRDDSPWRVIVPLAVVAVLLAVAVYAPQVDGIVRAVQGGGR